MTVSGLCTSSSRKHKAHKKEKKANKSLPAEQDNVADNLELVVTRLDDAIPKDGKKKKRRKSEAAPTEVSVPAVEEAAVVETLPEKKKRRKSEVAAAAVEVQQGTVSTVSL